ncbi:MAG: hypothetical protein ACJ76Z_07005 [Thermoleophilaceae bacterium]
MNAYASGVRLTRLGAVVLTVLAVCAALVVFASGGAQKVGLLLGAVILLLLFGEGASRGGGGIGSYRRKQEVFTREAEAWRQTHQRD